MTLPKGEKLFVNVGASEARRRLAGVGYGVRKVQSTGRHRAVVIHTATGRHAAALQAIFADVGFALSESDLADPIENLPNIGLASAAWPRAAGISTITDLNRFGPVAAYRLVKQSQPAASLNLLWALAAGLLGKDWRELTADEKQHLLDELHAG